MLSSVLRSPLAIQVNIGIIRAFVEFRKLANSLPMPNTSEDIAQLRKDFEELKLDIEDILQVGQSPLIRRGIKHQPSMINLLICKALQKS